MLDERRRLLVLVAVRLSTEWPDDDDVLETEDEENFIFLLFLFLLCSFSLAVFNCDSGMSPSLSDFFSSIGASSTIIIDSFRCLEKICPNVGFHIVRLITEVHVVSAFRFMFICWVKFWREYVYRLHIMVEMHVFSEVSLRTSYQV